MPSQAIDEPDQERVDCLRTLSLDPVPGPFQDVATAQTGQGLGVVVDLRLDTWELQHIVDGTSDEHRWLVDDLTAPGCQQLP